MLITNANLLLLFISIAVAQECYDICPSYTTPQQHRVKIGAYINSISALNIPESTVRFNFYLWLKWDNCQRDDDGEPFRPDKSIRVENDIVKVDTNINPTYEEPICIENNRTLYMEWSIEGEFFQYMNYKGYPLDRHQIEIQFEDVVYSRDSLVYVFDNDERRSASGIHESAILPGWNIVGLTEREEPSRYRTNTFIQVYGSSTYSRYSFSVEISRGAAVYILKTLPPILITLGISGMVLLLDVDAMDTRFATAIGGLMTCVFLQLTFSANLPPQVDYLTLLDWLFNMAYIVLLAIIVECIYIRIVYYRLLLESQLLKDEIVLQSLVAKEDKATINAIASNVEDSKRKKKKIKERIKRIEKIFFIGYCVFIALIVIVISLAGRFSQ